MITVSPGCFVGSPLDFLNWRVLLARAAGFNVEPWEQGDMTLIVPALPYDTLTSLNAMGLWDYEPDDVLLVLLAHADEEGAIYPQHITPLAERLEELLPTLADHSMHPEGSPAQLVEVEVTNKFIEGLRQADAAGLAVTFTNEDM